MSPAPESDTRVKVPVFPLPNVVHFPHTLLPLHVFEPRYRRMLGEVRDGEGLIAMALARDEPPPGDRPRIHGVGSVGRIELLHELPDGRCNLVLEGLARVRFGRLEERATHAPEDERFWAAELELLGEALPDMQDPKVAEAKADFLLIARRYGEQVLAGEFDEGMLGDALPYPMLVNRAATILRVGVEEKQSLLELGDVGERARRIEAWMEEQIAAQTVIERFDGRRPEDPGLN